MGPPPTKPKIKPRQILHFKGQTENRTPILETRQQGFAKARINLLTNYKEIFANSRTPAQDILRQYGTKRIKDFNISLEELKTLGCNAFNARQLGFPLTELIKYYKPIDLIDAGYKPKEIVEALKK